MLDKPDVDVLNELIDSGRNLLKPHVFEFDFLNDEFVPVSKGGKIPDQLFRIINNPEKQKKLIIYMNPPYAEAPNTKTLVRAGQNKPGVAVNRTYKKYFNEMGKASREVFAQFFTRICFELPHCQLASFAKLKFVSGFAFKNFRKFFQSEFKGGFIVIANTFDNVQGIFPIGFTVWNLENRKPFKKIACDVIEGIDRDIAAIRKVGKKTFYTHHKSRYINEWRRTFFGKGKERIGYLRLSGVDMQNNSKNFITSSPSENDFKVHLTADITQENLIEMAIYIAVRLCVAVNWTNTADQFLYPNDSYKQNRKFQNDCLVFALFCNHNKIQSQDGINHWIPFARKEVEGKDSFNSDFMYRFLQERGKFSKTAQAVFDAGKALWTYYHKAIRNDDAAGVNASLYDIRAYFKGRKNGRVNTKSTDVNFNTLDQALKDTLKVLAEEIKPLVYEYGFLMK
ncbi:MAG: hypothetical protein LBT46_03105 [Planctomycetaceae bacterium]|nr:hypothetical protein [Planctomycetaceae bacterium]